MNEVELEDVSKDIENSDETIWLNVPTDRYCPECYQENVVAVVQGIEDEFGHIYPSNDAEFLMCTDCSFSWDGSMHGLKN